jgi:hypothetical protein
MGTAEPSQALGRRTPPYTLYGGCCTPSPAHCRVPRDVIVAAGVITLGCRSRARWALRTN